MHQVNWSQFGNSLIYSIVLICYTVEPLNFEVLLLVVDVGVGVDVGAGAGVGAGASAYASNSITCMTELKWVQLENEHNLFRIRIYY